MITETFDNMTEEIIKVIRNENAIKIDACILTFSHVILNYVLENFECTKLGDLFSSNGAKPIYGFEYENRYFAVYMSCVGAPTCVADIEDTLMVINTDKYIVFGGSGCLNKEIARGKVMVPTSAYRDEGTSYHYAPPSRFMKISEKARKAIEETILEHSMKYQEVITWSTDGFFRETKEKVAYRKSEGCAVVEMECSALAACADFRDATWGMILYTADSLADVDKYDERNWGGNAYEYALTLCLDAVIKL